MSDSTHTPGPWAPVLRDDPRGQPVPYYRALIAWIACSPDRRLTVIQAEERTVSKDEWEPNTRLIAAAPDLLDACLYAFEHLHPSMHYANVQRVLAASIAKARSSCLSCGEDPDGCYCAYEAEPEEGK